MCQRRGLSRKIALAALAGSLAWNPQALALEEAETATGAPSEEPFYHTVESGETLSGIADRYGTSVASLIRENEIDNPGDVWAGVQLLIPASAKRIPALDVAPEVDASAPESTEIASSLDRCEADLRAAYFERALECAAE
ncbi:MAG: LysM peptidoglycan-binding domain-containing protein, partial [Deltaproteobacteria bacterium]|nr:LysM peptidoglycan-binding domain-containing protein [Deltaproteobacteria bacterium]